MQIRKLLFTLWLTAMFASINALAQNQAPQRSPLNATGWGVVYDIPATKDVKVNRNVPYLKDAHGALAIDIYSPPNVRAGERRPAVVFINAIGDFGDQNVKDWEIYKTWPRLAAAHGLIGISMEADGARIQGSLRGVFDFLTNKGADYGIDGTRLGLYAASANVTGTTAYLASEFAAKGIRAAALYYGAVPTTPLRGDLPVLFIVAESDVPNLGTALPALWQRVIETKAPWSLLFARGLPHGFDAFADNDDSRRIVQQTLAFWKSHLEPVPQPGWQPSAAREVIATI